MQLIESYQRIRKISINGWGSRTLTLGVAAASCSLNIQTGSLYVLIWLPVQKTNAAKLQLWKSTLQHILAGCDIDGKKKGLKVPGNFGSNTTEPAEDRIRYIFLSSLQKRRMREDFIALYNSLRRDCWHLEKHKDKYCLSLLKTVKPFPLYWRPHHFSVFNWSWNKGFIFGK